MDFQVIQGMSWPAMVFLLYGRVARIPGNSRYVQACVPQSWCASTHQVIALANRVRNAILEAGLALDMGPTE